MSKYPRQLLIQEDVIREFEEKIGVRFIDKTECANALMEHDKQIRADAINEFVQYYENGDCVCCDKSESDEPFGCIKCMAEKFKLKRDDNECIQ